MNLSDALLPALTVNLLIDSNCVDLLIDIVDWW